MHCNLATQDVALAKWADRQNRPTHCQKTYQYLDINCVFFLVWNNFAYQQS
ncbi:MAG: hypothetical protein KGV51_06000 [Moraxellaceae bacterium]|nr:hypothetical protein [Moraxellaceae bacterium]MBS9780164.1 hypothetical protein [Moraxellaceae bacterium]